MCPKCGSADSKVRVSRSRHGGKVWVGYRNECVPCKRTRDEERFKKIRADPKRWAKRLAQKNARSYRRGEFAPRQIERRHGFAEPR